MPEEHEPFAAEEPDQLVVDADHVKLVSDALTDLGVDFVPGESDDRLGLALLTEIKGAVVDDVLGELRRRFAGRFAGWQVPLGKHRKAEGVIGPAGPKPMTISTAGPKPMEGGTPQQVAGPIPGPPAAPDAGRNVRIAMIDTPLFRHTSLNTANIQTAWGHFTPGAEPAKSGHGTFVASIIQFRAPAASIRAEGLLVGPNRTASEWEVAGRLVRLADEVDVINLSLASFTADGRPPLVISRAIERVRPGVVVVAAAGNHGDLTSFEHSRTSRSPAWPAALPRVAAVGAVGALDAPDESPVFSPHAPWITFLAPGVEVVGAYPFSAAGGGQVTGFAQWSGTSFAAAAVSGEIAAEMTRGGGSAAAALARLLGGASPVVRKFEWRDDTDHA